MHSSSNTTNENERILISFFIYFENWKFDGFFFEKKNNFFDLIILIVSERSY